MSRMFLVGLALMALAIRPVQADGPRLLVLNKTDDTLSIIDPEKGTSVATVPTGHGPHEVAVSADGRTAFVSNYGDQQPGNSLSVVDLAAAKELRRVDLGTTDAAARAGVSSKPRCTSRPR